MYLQELITIGNVIIINAPNLVGFILPPFVELLNRDIKNEKAKYIVEIIVCFLVAVLLDWNQIVGGTPQQVLLYTALIFTESNTIFKLYFATSALRGSIQNIGNKQGVGEPQIVPETQRGD